MKLPGLLRARNLPPGALGLPLPARFCLIAGSAGLPEAENSAAAIFNRKELSKGYANYNYLK
jgi:hypothetical protein